MNNKKIIKKCKYCNKEFESYISNNIKFCSRICCNNFSPFYLKNIPKSKEQKIKISETRKRLFKENKLMPYWLGKKNLALTKRNLENNPMKNPESRKKMILKKIKYDRSIMIKCGCGKCKELRPKYDKEGRECKYIKGHCISGEKHPFYGRKLSGEHKKNIGLGGLGRKTSEETKLKISLAHKGKKQLEKTKEKMSNSKKELFKKGKLKIWNTGLTKETDERIRLNIEKTTETLKKSYKSGKIKVWSKDLTKETDERLNYERPTKFKKGKEHPFLGINGDELLKKNRKSMSIRPNKPETIVLNLIKDNNLPFNYVGDGVIWFRGENNSFNPDFLSKNPKHIIEVFGDYWHNLPKIKERDIERLKTYEKYGYKTLVIWEHELNNLDLILNKIKGFLSIT